MKGKPQTAGEWADALEDEAIAEVVDQNGTVDEIRDAHERIIRELFEQRAEANTHTPALVKGFMDDMREALQRVMELADVREKEAAEEAAENPDVHTEDTDETVVINADDIDPADLAQGKFSNLAA